MIAFKLPDKDWGQEKFPAVKIWLCGQLGIWMKSFRGNFRFDELTIRMTKRQALALAQTEEVKRYVENKQNHGRNVVLVGGVPTILYGMKVHVI